MAEDEKWTCSKCGHVNDPSAVRVSGMSFGGESFSDFIERARSAGQGAQERLKKYCGNCGAERAGTCFIATAAFGSALAPEVVVLRDFRDTELVRRPLGRLVIRLYERVSPPMAQWIRRHPPMGSYVQRLCLSPFVWILRKRRRAILR